MCVNKLYLRSNKLEFDPLVDRAYNYVCCGQCEECLRLKTLSYEIRAIDEFEHTKSIGCTSHFYTLTYSNEYLPVFDGVPCFSKRDIQLFFKRFRKYLDKHGFSTKFRYFLTSEYGHEKTRNYRPHYHLILFMRNSFSPVVLNEIVQKTWQYGHVEPGSENLGLITDVRPFGYCVKYLNKDDDVNNYLDFVYSDDSINLFVDNKQDIPYSILPFHLQSKGFGSGLCHFLTDNDFINGYFVRTDSLGVSRKLPIPLYIKRKCLYKTYVNKNGNIGYVLNQRGIDVFRPMIKRQIKTLSETFDDLLNSCKFEDSNAKYFNYLFDSPLAFEHFKSEYKRLDYSNKLARYIVLYKDRPFVNFSFVDEDKDIKTLLDFQCVEHSPFEQMINNCYPYKMYDDCLIKYFDTVARRVSYSKYINDVQAYNTRQQYLSFRTKKYKPVRLKSINSFINQKFKNRCLTLLSRREKSVQTLAS